jgi:hypothetical protein
MTDSHRDAAMPVTTPINPAPDPAECPSPTEQPPGFRKVKPKPKPALPARQKAQQDENPAKGSRVPIEEQKRKTLERQRAYQARLKREKGVVQVCVFAPEHRTDEIRLLARLLREDPDLELDLEGSSEQEPDL